jgi:hypothetical protein
MRKALFVSFTMRRVLWTVVGVGMVSSPASDRREAAKLFGVSSLYFFLLPFTSHSLKGDKRREMHTTNSEHSCIHKFFSEMTTHIPARNML